MEGFDEAKQKGLIALFDYLRLFPSTQEITASTSKLKAKYPDALAGELARRIVDKATWVLTGTGVVASLPGAIPGLGTAVEIGFTAVSITGETWLILRNLTVMQLMVAGVYGHDLDHPDRKDEMILIWGLETGAIVPAKEAAKRIGTRIAISQFNQRVSGKILQWVNQKLGTTVLTKWGVKRGGIALGRLLPFCVGAVVGGGINFASARSFGAACLRFYSEILPGDEKVIILD